MNRHIEIHGDLQQAGGDIINVTQAQQPHTIYELDYSELKQLLRWHKAQIRSAHWRRFINVPGLLITAFFVFVIVTLAAIAFNCYQAASIQPFVDAFWYFSVWLRQHNLYFYGFIIIFPAIAYWLAIINKPEFALIRESREVIDLIRVELRRRK